MKRSSMSVAEANDNPFKWKHFSDEIILWAVRWYCQFAQTYRDLIMMMAERGLSACQTTVMWWVHQYAPPFKVVKDEELVSEGC
jgi:transposase-like protein